MRTMNTELIYPVLAVLLLAFYFLIVKPAIKYGSGTLVVKVILTIIAVLSLAGALFYSPIFQ